MRKPRGQKIYAGEFPRPTLETEIHENEKTIIIGTPWGSHSALKTLDDSVKDFLASSVGDQEATSPFARLPGLSTAENNLRSALLVANDLIYQKCNKEAYTSSCEALVIHFHNSEMAWVQIGQPHLLLLRGGRLYPLHVTLDLSVDFENLTPIPSKLIGVERAWDLEVRSLKLTDNDTLVALARSLIPPTFFSQKLSNLDQEKMLQLLFDCAVKDNDKMPFSLLLI